MSTVWSGGDSSHQEFFSAGWDATVRRWSRETGETLKTYSGPTFYRINALIITKSTVFAAGDKNVCRAWYRDSGKDRMRVMTENTIPMSQMLYHPETKRIHATQGFYFTPYDPATGQAFDDEKLKEHHGAVDGAALDPETNYLLTGARDRSAILWDLPKREVLARFINTAGRKGARIMGGIRSVAIGKSFVDGAGHEHLMDQITETATAETAPTRRTGAPLGEFLRSGHVGRSTNPDDLELLLAPALPEDEDLPEPAPAPAAPALPSGSLLELSEAGRLSEASKRSKGSKGSKCSKGSKGSKGSKDSSGSESAPASEPAAPAPATAPEPTPAPAPTPAKPKYDTESGFSPEDEAMLDGRSWNEKIGSHNAIEYVKSLKQLERDLKDRLREDPSALANALGRAATTHNPDEVLRLARRYAMGRSSNNSTESEKTKFVWTGEETGQILKWDLNLRRPVQAVQLPRRDEVRRMVLLESKDMLIVGGLSGALYGLNATSGLLVWQTKAHELGITAITIRGDQLWTASSDTKVRQWSFSANHKRPPTLQGTWADRDGGSGPIHCIAFYKPTHKYAGTDEFLLTGGTDLLIRAWNLTKGGVLAFTFAGHRTPVENFIIRDNILYSGSEDLFTHNLDLALGWNIIQAHDLSDKSGESDVARLTSQYGNVGEWSFQALLLFIEVMQLVSFGFVTPIPWNSELLVEIIAAFQTLLFNFPNVDYVLELAAAGVAVLLFLFIFLSQERLERAKFMKTSSPRRDDWLQYAWILVSASIKLFSRPAFLPLMRVLVKTASCQAMNVEAEAIQTDTCYQGVHLIYIGAAALFVLLYLPLVTRLGLVLGELDNVEVKRNVFDWSEDRLEPKVGHPLSYTVHATKYFGLTLFAKTVLLVVTVMIAPNSEAIVTPDQLLFVSWVLIAVGVAITPVTYLYPPYFSDRACAIRSALDIGVAWTYVCSLVAVLIAERGDVNQTAVWYLAAGITPLMLISYFVYMAWARRRRARVVMGGGEVSQTTTTATYRAPIMARRTRTKVSSKAASKVAKMGPDDYAIEM